MHIVRSIISHTTILVSLALYGLADLIMRECLTSFGWSENLVRVISLVLDLVLGIVIVKKLTIEITQELPFLRAIELPAFSWFRSDKNSTLKA